MNDRRLVRIDGPFRDGFGLTPNLGGLLEDFFGKSQLETPRWSGGCAGWVPKVDVRETDSEVILSAALPGINKKDVSLEIREGSLILTGASKTDVEKDSEGWVRREIGFGRFYRAFQLPPEVDTKKINAKHEDGVLTIRLPKAESAKPHSVEIE